MIYVVDNGETYSDHGIHFVEVHEMQLNDDEMESMKDLLTFSREDSFIIASADTFTWYQGECQQLHEFVSPNNWFADCVVSNGRWTTGHYRYDLVKNPPKISLKLAKSLLTAWTMDNIHHDGRRYGEYWLKSFEDILNDGFYK